ncbi:MAG: TonB-dependent receptor [Gammaproteobacteria bacterium]|nr:TonB-dependent receptor [Gammaproteobacteria bacterium]MBU1776509.1 TonB-dependent receptor [Gammaproteobacteria bacterium]MBU1969050.1 TonB-dependent receptor [Gammaproteobacteria bacterium]
MRTFTIRAAALIALLAAATQTAAATAEEESWPELSLGDLMKVGIETAARKSQSVSNTAAAVFVISASDIKRSGALTLPEVLHLAPGVEVARLANNKFAVSIRGFNGRMANKLLVLVDGRSIYSSLYGGVIWEAEDMPLEEINRIEVIRGSAGLAWGSNAVNGVINIITKRAQDTSGWLVDSHAGTETGKAGLALRYGMKSDDGSALRVTVSEQRRDGGKEVNGRETQDFWNDTTLNFRYDRPDGADTRWFFSGRVFDSHSDESWLIPTFDPAAMYDATSYGNNRLASFVTRRNGGDLLGRFERSTVTNSEVRVQAYIEKFQGNVTGSSNKHRTLDLDAQHRFLLGEAHDIVWGGNWRQTDHHNYMDSGVFLTTANPDTTVTLSSLFAQDEWTLVPHLFSLQAGIRIEKQTFGGTAPQPSVRALWTPSEQHSFWLSWSKTVRSPSVVQQTMGAYAVADTSQALPALVYAVPGEQSGFGNEKVRTLEFGHRAQWMPSFFSDLSAYVSKYEGVFGVVGSAMTANGNAAFTGLPVDPTCTADLVNFGLNPAAPGLCITHLYGNAAPVRTRGVELATEWNPLAVWRLQLNVSRMWMDAGADTATDSHSLLYGSSPKYQGSLRSSYNFTADRQFDLWLRRIGGLTRTSAYTGTVGATPVAARTELDLRYAEQVTPSLELSLVLQNLLSKQEIQSHPDYIPSLPTVPQRTIYLKALWHD